MNEVNLTPEFLGVVEKYVYNFLRTHYWRVEKTMDKEDVVQEAYLQLVRTVRRLEKNGYKIQNDAHMMSLFKTSWSRYFTDLTNKDTKNGNTYSANVVIDGEELNLLETMIGESDNEGFISSAIDNAPQEIQQVLKLLLTAPEEVLELLRGKNSANTLSAMLGCNTSINLMQETKAYVNDILY